MWTKVGVGLYCVAALWLATFVAYLVYLLLPFGVGLLASSFAALVAVLLLISLIRRLIVGPLKGEPIGRWRSILVSAVALATLTLDAGWTHYLVPFPPTDQDDCTFGPIGPGEFRALKREMAAKFNPDWGAVARVRGAADEFGRKMADVLPKEANPEQLMAHIHALARSLGAELDGGGYEGAGHAWYFYYIDLNKTAAVRRFLFRWAKLTFHMTESEPKSGRSRLKGAHLLMPDLKGPEQHPPRSRSCPPMPRSAEAAVDRAVADPLVKKGSRSGISRGKE
jgi:hypothetical protein